MVSGRIEFYIFGMMKRQGGVQHASSHSRPQQRRYERRSPFCRVTSLRIIHVMDVMQLIPYACMITFTKRDDQMAGLFEIYNNKYLKDLCLEALLINQL